MFKGTQPEPLQALREFREGAFALGDPEERRDLHVDLRGRGPPAFVFGSVGFRV